LSRIDGAFEGVLARGGAIRGLVLTLAVVGLGVGFGFGVVAIITFPFVLLKFLGNLRYLLE
jgi:hypothetical protein